MTPVVTVCIPAYNARRYLPATLSSLRAQSNANWELIVTEDGSADPVADLVHAFAATVPQRVTYQRHLANRGLPATRNAAIAAARTPWIALLDADDLWAADHLADLLACAARDPAATFIHSGSVLFDSATEHDLANRAPSPAALTNFPRSLYLGDYAVQPSSVMFTKKLWTRVHGFNPAYRYVEDREMWLRCARAGANFTYTGRATCRYRQHGTALTTHHVPMALASAAVLQQHLDWDILSPAARRRHTAEAWVSAGRLARRATPQVARECFARAWAVQRTPRIAAFWLAAALATRRPAATAPAATSAA